MKDDVEACDVKEIESIEVEDYEDVAKILNVLGNKARIAILEIIFKYKEVCACELQPALRMPQPTITAHLRKMYNVGILKQKEVWKYSYYYINPTYNTLIHNILKSQYNDSSTPQDLNQKTRRVNRRE